MMSPSPRQAKTGSWTLRILTVFIALGLGFAGGWLIADRPALEGVDASLGNVTYPIKEAGFSDVRKIQLQVRNEAAVTVVVPDSGTITSLHCEPGQKVNTGDILLAINDQPRIVLVSEVPFYRDLQGGEQGNDVNALRHLLRQQGFDLPETGAFDRQAREALNKFMTLNGAQSSKKSPFIRRNFVWLPKELSLTSCAVSVGDQVDPGDSLATSEGGVQALEFRLPDDAIPGAREIIVGDAVVQVGDDRSITNPTSLATLLQTAQAQQALEAEDNKSATIPAQAQLSQPLTAYGVPPSALFAAHGPTGEVCTGDAKVKVTILGSSLGITYVTFDDDPPHEVILRPREVETCG